MTEPKPGSSLQKLDLSDNEWTRYVDRVRDAQDARDLRRGARLRKIVQCVLRVDAGDEAHVYVIHSRDISDGGMSFMHSTALPHEAGCTVVLETNTGSGHVVEGSVRWTREVGGGLHAVGIVFHQALDLSEFIDVPGGAYAA